MKKLVSIMICIILMISLVSVSASAADNEGVLTLPEDDGSGYPVTGISSDNYRNNDDVTKLIVPENIVRLGERAFWGCSNLEQIKLHDKIQVIGSGAFEATAYYKDKSNWEDGVLYIGDCLIKADPKEIADTYKRLGNTKKVFDFQKLINEAKDPRKYLDMIEPEYEVRCEYFFGDNKTINIIHENLINVCEELGLFDKASYYRAKLNEWLEAK